jgi:hypothetical protein
MSIPSRLAEASLKLATTRANLALAAARTNLALARRERVRALAVRDAVREAVDADKPLSDIARLYWSRRTRYPGDGACTIS